jgi:O-antigen ligase
MTVVLLLIVAVLCLAAFAWFLHLERTGRPLTVILFLVGLLVVESALYYSPNEVALGLLHPEIGPLSFRVFDVLIPFAALARLLAGHRASLPPAVLWWLPFVAWTVTSGILGFLQGNDPNLITFEGKLVVYLLMVPLAAGVPARAYLESRGARRLIGASAVLAMLLSATHLLNVRLHAAIPLLPLDQLGTFGSDLASIFVAMGTVVLAVTLVVDRRRGWGLAAALPLLLCPIAVGQRAAMIGLIVSIGILAVMVPFGRRAVRTTPTEIALVIAVGACIVLLPTVAPAVTEDKAGPLPFANLVEQAFTSRSKQLSSEDRVYQWRKARQIIAERPLFGWGLGHEYVTWDPGYYTWRQTNLTHNIVGDLLMRTGVVGLVLFVIPVALGLLMALRGWRGLLDPRLAAIALGAAAAVGGLLAKGLVESIFEKYRLSIVLAVMFGIIVAMERELRDPLPVTLSDVESLR